MWDRPFRLSTFVELRGYDLGTGEATTVIPDSVTTRPRARSSSGSKPTLLFSGNTTSSSRMARRTLLYRPIRARGMIIESSISL
jgi:hypothetical protein